jgi:Lysine methyltransferase
MISSTQFLPNSDSTRNESNVGSDPPAVVGDAVEDVCDYYDDDVDDEDCFADVGFMFESNQPVKLQDYTWTLLSRARPLSVSIHAVDDTPGAIQSGHYLWPGAKYLADYLVQEQQNGCHSFAQSTTNEQISVETGTNDFPQYAAIIELGAGCALASLVALQLYSSSLQCLLISDHDPGVLARASDNYESTLQKIMDNISTKDKTVAEDLADSKATEGSSDVNADNDKLFNRGTSSETLDSEHFLNHVINTIASIPVLFEQLSWGVKQKKILTSLYNQMMDHVNDDDGSPVSMSWLILGSDLIYSADIVKPLFETVSQIMVLSKNSARFILSQSFVYDEMTEFAIDNACIEFDLERTVLVSEDEDAARADTKIQTFKRVQEFVPRTKKEHF